MALLSVQEGDPKKIAKKGQHLPFRVQKRRQLGAPQPWGLSRVCLHAAESQNHKTGFHRDVEDLASRDHQDFMTHNKDSSNSRTREP
jgi:hypothetical protein